MHCVPTLYATNLETYHLIKPSSGLNSSNSNHNLRLRTDFPQQLKRLSLFIYTHTAYVRIATHTACVRIATHTSYVRIITHTAYVRITHSLCQNRYTHILCQNHTHRTESHSPMSESLHTQPMSESLHTQPMSELLHTHRMSEKSQQCSFNNYINHCFLLSISTCKNCIKKQSSFNYKHIRTSFK